ncbi:PLAC8-domain-containing protein [Hypoxylon sp. EC38]|nr:PLAC8-domain-containing protein [Hypoxylon sp. EC38]
MDTQEKFLYLGPEQSRGIEPDHQHQQPMPGQPPVGAYVHPQAQSPPPQGQAQAQPPLQPQPQINAYPQIALAYGQQGGEWQASLCDCSPCTSCLLGFCLPCILLGQTSERIRDPTMQTADMMNSDCMIYTLISCFTGCGWIYALMKRDEIRKRYQIQGSSTSDCCVSYWCPCCALIQQDNEVLIRQRNAQPVIAQGYQPQPAMQMQMQMPMPAPIPTPAPSHQQP